MKTWQVMTSFGMTLLLLFNVGCATGQTRKIALGMLGGAAVGAVVGHEFVHHGDHKQFETRNTIISSVVFALATGAVMGWHYEAMQEQMVEVSARYSRYRLCNPDEMTPDLAHKLGLGETEAAASPLTVGQIGKFSIALDDNTRWAYPVFRKRYLQAERGENQLLSSRYIWEILKPGSFVTRSQDPQFFVDQGGEQPNVKTKDE